MSEDRFPHAHADHPVPEVDDPGGFDLIPCGVVSGARMPGAANRMAHGQHALYRLIVRAEALGQAVGRLSLPRVAISTRPAPRPDRQ